ncbi:hypothetical protein L1987_24920 [Smallanthus sonchifolius]|uniref:Uncharacterized protein n=1 Tax=Smallanthus sonchifolius TaxID=185202 RepID=A0ACB9ILK0_9ASTR|nr:hypothetical protein L1987_24920 [Smallanthus sonchifolius]
MASMHGVRGLNPSMEIQEQFCIVMAIHHTKLVVDSSVTLLKYAYPLLKQRVLHWILESNTVGAILYQSLKLLFPVLAAKR